MRSIVYVILGIFSVLLMADVHYVKEQRRPPEVVLNYDLNKLDEVVAELRKMLSRAKYDESLLLIHDAIKVHGDDPRLILIRADTMIGIGKLESALIDLDAVVKAEPENLNARAQRARCLRDLHKIDEALVDVEILLKADPGSESGHFLMGTIQYARGQYQEAITSFTSGLQTNPDSLSTLYNRAQCYAELKQFDKARADMIAFMEKSDSEKLKETAVEILREWKDK